MSIVPIHPQRVRQLGQKTTKKNGPIIYWMSRDQRVHDNWALTHAQYLAYTQRKPMVVLFALSPSFLGATSRSYDFMLQGLREVEKDLAHLQIPFYILVGDPPQKIAKSVKEWNASVVVTDFSPLRIKRQWESELISKINVPLHVVDAHNVVPCWYVSDKREYGAYTIRPKIHRLLKEFEGIPPTPHKQLNTWQMSVPKIDWDFLNKSLSIDRSISAVTWIAPGSVNAGKKLSHFINLKLETYSQTRNDPTMHGQSDLSPYLHYGHIYASRVMQEVVASSANIESKKAFLEELVVRRELSDNFCWYTPHYDDPRGFPTWAKISHEKHSHDSRSYVYTLEQCEQAQTHDLLWNAAHNQMVRTGKMHGYMRMYWAKKILEWTSTVDEAMRIAIYLNDRFELDGRDPNGYAGIAWCLGGVHDRPWFTRPIFGKIRFMSASGAQKKFDVDVYIKQHSPSRLFS